MKKLAIVFVLLWSTTAGAVPSTINFTGRLTTSTGPVTGSVNLTLKLYDVASGGTAVWTEIHSNVGADNGLVFVDAGTLTTLDETVFDGRRLYLEIVVGIETLAPRLAINSVPYAVRAEAARNADFLGASIGPGDVVTSVNGSAGVLATKTGNAVAVSLSTTGCASGQAFKYNGTTFACATDLNTTYTGGTGVAVAGTTISLSTTGCAAGSVWKYNGTTFACAPDLDTTYTGGTGVSIAGTTIALSTVGCAAGSVWKYNGTAFACAPDANTAYTGGTGVSVAGTTIALSTTGCAAGFVWKYNGTTFSCQADANTTYTATAPISIVGTTVSLSSAGCGTSEVLQWNGTAWGCKPVFTGTSCTWAVATGTVSSFGQSVNCPVGKHPISGGCDAAGAASLLFSRPFGPPSDGAVADSVNAWNCAFSVAAVGHSAYALCCNTI